MTYPPVVFGAIDGDIGREQVVILCPYCTKQHWHSLGDGHRVSHCATKVNDDIGYIVILEKREMARYIKLLISKVRDLEHQRDQPGWDRI